MSCKLQAVVTTGVTASSSDLSSIQSFDALVVVAIDPVAACPPLFQQHVHEVTLQKTPDLRVPSSVDNLLQAARVDQRIARVGVSLVVIQIQPYPLNATVFPCVVQLYAAAYHSKHCQHQSLTVILTLTPICRLSFLQCGETHRTRTLGVWFVVPWWATHPVLDWTLTSRPRRCEIWVPTPT